MVPSQSFSQAMRCNRQQVALPFKTSRQTRLRELKAFRARHILRGVVMTQGPQTAVKPAEQMKQLMLDIVHALVDEPEEVVVETIEDQESTVIRLRVAHQDIGKVIGKQGRTARSLRTILGAASMKLQHRYGLDIVESDHGGGRGE